MIIFDLIGNAVQFAFGVFWFLLQLAIYLVAIAGILVFAFIGLSVAAGRSFNRRNDRFGG